MEARNPHRRQGRRPQSHSAPSPPASAGDTGRGAIRCTLALRSSAPQESAPVASRPTYAAASNLLAIHPQSVVATWRSRTTGASADERPIVSGLRRASRLGPTRVVDRHDGPGFHLPRIVSRREIDPSHPTPGHRRNGCPRGMQSANDTLASRTRQVPERHLGAGQWCPESSKRLSAVRGGTGPSWHVDQRTRGRCVRRRNLLERNLLTATGRHALRRGGLRVAAVHAWVLVAGCRYYLRCRAARWPWLRASDNLRWHFLHWMPTGGVGDDANPLAHGNSLSG